MLCVQLVIDKLSLSRRKLAANDSLVPASCLLAWRSLVIYWDCSAQFQVHPVEMTHWKQWHGTQHSWRGVITTSVAGHNLSKRDYVQNCHLSLLCNIQKEDISLKVVLKCAQFDWAREDLDKLVQKPSFSEYIMVEMPMGRPVKVSSRLYAKQKVRRELGLEVQMTSEQFLKPGVSEMDYPGSLFRGKGSVGHRPQ